MQFSNSSSVQNQNLGLAGHSNSISNNQIEILPKLPYYASKTCLADQMEMLQIKTRESEMRDNQEKEKQVQADPLALLERFNKVNQYRNCLNSLNNGDDDNYFSEYSQKLFFEQGSLTNAWK